MPIPKTNLFKDDRVKLSKTYLNQLCMTRKIGRWGRLRLEEKRGTIVNDTLSKQANFIQVLWDGNKTVTKSDYYTPDELELVEN